MDAPRTPESPDLELLGVSPPEHGVAGHVLIALMYGAIPTAMLIAILVEPHPPGDWGMMVWTVILGALSAFIAESFRRFEAWSWFFLVLLVGRIVFEVVLVLDEVSPGEAAAIAGGCAPMLALVHYLWARRWQFWSDPPARASRSPERRWVTPAWRAARLARMADVHRRALSDTFQR
ncbi:hypothetical protein [Longimicrobium sp.]|uniref:hypothetical protein n=1 Tax=Longimicrobium sp. TaxID=2029185 RepID=UPI002E33F471|nr:hypothetical protein [Longimicrobium sp.]HEX6040217.1 hypothetical protein [Longimicrobium sp.]